VKVAGYVSVNSGVLGLEVARSKGASRILLLGFDMHGTHFFGPYTNGLSNTTDQRRRMHLAQYDRWAARNRGIEVFNCTAGSALKCFPEARLDDFCSDVQVAHEIGRASWRGRGEVRRSGGGSRRRHTRFSRDWSSDVCSSDLARTPTA